MLRSPHLQSNPSLFAFLPLFYTVWSDAVLTPSEVSTIEGLIDNQHWLSDDERNFLHSQINPLQPPSVEDLMEWKEEIKKAADQTDGKSLVDIGFQLAHMHGAVSAELLKERKALGNIEATLGFISHEAAYNFQSGKRDSVTQQLTTHQTFDVEAMTKILDGKNTEIIRKVKTVLDDPEFRYIDPGNLPLYRA